MKWRFIFVFMVALVACAKKDNGLDSTRISLKFTQSWDAVTIGNTNINNTFYTNAFGTQMNIVKLRYLLSNISLQDKNDNWHVLKKHHLIDVTKSESLNIVSEIEVPVGSYKQLKITFGFNNTDNIDGQYADLNSVLWNVPGMLGGGYHFMQLEGQFINSNQITTNYQFHTIRAVDNSGASLKFTDTFFEKNLGAVTITAGEELRINMNVAEWFKNPTTWNLNTLHSMMMPNYSAQIAMFDNGQNVFSLQ